MRDLSQWKANLSVAFAIVLAVTGAFYKFDQVVGDPHTDQVAALNLWTYNTWVGRVLFHGNDGRIYHPFPDNDDDRTDPMCLPRLGGATRSLRSIKWTAQGLESCGVRVACLGTVG